MSQLLELLPRPLDPLRSFKFKTAVLVGVALLIATCLLWITAEWKLRYALTLALFVSFGATWFLAHGMTSPLRDMTAAARSMAQGDYSRRIRSTSRDEVGQLATAFNHMAAELQSAERYRRELVGNVSHELRTPITALQAVLENIVDGVAEPDPQTLKTALAQTERLGRLVDDLLDLSKLENGSVPVQRESFAVREFVDDAVTEAKTTGRQVRYHVTVEPFDLAAVADTARLHQVVANLLDNASRHSPPGDRCRCSRAPRTTRCCWRSPTPDRVSPRMKDRECSSDSPTGIARWRHRLGAGHRAMGRRSAWRPHRNRGRARLPGASHLAAVR